MREPAETVAELRDPQLWVDLSVVDSDWVWAHLTDAGHGVGRLPAALMPWYGFRPEEVLGVDDGYDPQSVAAAARIACADVRLGDLVTALVDAG